jgi:hypothetical protein
LIAFSDAIVGRTGDVPEVSSSVLPIDFELGIGACTPSEIEWDAEYFCIREAAIVVGEVWVPRIIQDSHPIVYIIGSHRIRYLS